MQPPTSPPATPADDAADRAGQGSDATRIAGWLGLVGLAAFAFWPLLSFDPRAGVVRATSGIEGALFEPAGSDPRLIAALAAWLLVTRRGRLAAAWRDGLGDARLGGGLLVGSLAVAAWATWVSAPDLLIHSLQLFVLGMAAMLGGPAGLRAVWLPTAFLLLAMPTPAALLNGLLLPLQLATVQACAKALQAIGLEAWGVGDQLLMRRGIFHVIESCSGVRLMQTLVMASVVYAELFGRGVTRALVLLALAPAVGLVVNFARILSIVFNPYGSISSVHTTQGVAMVVVGVLLLAGIDHGLERVRPSLPRQAGERAPLLAMQLDRRWVASALGLASIATWVWLGPHWTPPETGPSPIWELPDPIDGLHANGETLDLVFLGSVYFSDRIYQTYSSTRVGEPAPADVPQRTPITLLIGEDDHLNRRGSLLSDKTAYPGRGWQLAARSRAVLSDGQPAELLLFSGTGLHGRSSRYMALHWREGFAAPAVEALRAWLGLDRSGFRRPQPARVWRVGLELDGQTSDLESARDELLGFARAARTALREVESGGPTGG